MAQNRDANGRSHGSEARRIKQREQRVLQEGRAEADNPLGVLLTSMEPFGRFTGGLSKHTWLYKRLRIEVQSLSVMLERYQVQRDREFGRLRHHK